MGTLHFLSESKTLSKALLWQLRTRARPIYFCGGFKIFVRVGENFTINQVKFFIDLIDNLAHGVTNH